MTILFCLSEVSVCLFDVAHMRLEIANQLHPPAVIRTQFEIVILILKAFVPTGIWILAVNAIFPPSPQACSPSCTA